MVVGEVGRIFVSRNGQFRKVAGNQMSVCFVVMASSSVVLCGMIGQR